jgi:hypothetical protein
MKHSDLIYFNFLQLDKFIGTSMEERSFEIGT